MFNLNGKTALITGASGGIGKSIAHKMKLSGARIILSGTRKEVLDDLAIDLGGEVKVIFDLNSNITPYVFPFRCDNINAIKKKLNKISLDCYKWPELPEEIKLSCPEYYGNVWMVPFLW